MDLSAPAVAEVIVTLWLNREDHKGLSLLHLCGLRGLCGLCG
jgi:hypothetical protein